MIDIKSWIGIGATIAVIALSVFAGQKIGHWQASAEYEVTAKADAEQILTLSGQNAQLLLGIAANNQAVAVAEAKTESAQAAVAQAQKYADGQAVLSASRMNNIEKALKDAKTVGEVLSRYWELRE